MQSNQHRQGEPLAGAADQPPPSVGPIAVAQDIYQDSGITVSMHLTMSRLHRAHAV